MITGINFLVMVLGAYFFAVRLLASIFNCCYGCCHCLAFATALGVRWNPLGQICSHNIAPSTFKDDKWSDATTYESDASVLNTLGMVSAFIWCCQCCVCWVPLILTPVDKKKKKQDADVDSQQMQ